MTQRNDKPNTVEMYGIEWDVIDTYSRAEAIADGVLVDLMQPETVKLVKEAGYTVPVAMTATAFAATVRPIGDPGFEYPVGQSLDGRLWDVLFVLRYAIQTGRGDAVHFPITVWDGDKPVEVKLWCRCGPGDQGEPVLTIMLEGED